MEEYLILLTTRVGLGMCGGVSENSNVSKIQLGFKPRKLCTNFGLEKLSNEMIRTCKGQIVQVCSNRLFRFFQGDAAVKMCRKKKYRYNYIFFINHQMI